MTANLSDGFNYKLHLPSVLWAGYPAYPGFSAVINGISIDRIIVLPAEARQQARAIYIHGQALGNNPQAFSKVGDSTIENPHFMTRFDDGPFNLGAYAFLQLVVDHFQDSFARQGVAVRRGLHAWSLFDTLWANKTYCLGIEAPLAYEFRLHRPSVVFIRLGSNDVGRAELFEHNITQAVEFSIQRGVIPVLGAKADRHDGPANTNNNIIRQVAAQYDVPLWDFDYVAGTLPGRGLEVDGVHLTSYYAHDYTQLEAFTRGYAVHNLTALLALDTIWRTAMMSIE